jgi:hypothetical protein
MRSGRPLFHQTLDALVGRLLERRFGASPSALEKGGSLLPDEAGRQSRIEAVVHKSTRGRGRSRWARDPQKRAALCASSLSCSRLAFWLHFPYEILLRWEEVMAILCMDGRFFGGWMDLASLPCHTRRSSVQLSCASV